MKRIKKALQKIANIRFHLHVYLLLVICQ